MILLFEQETFDWIQPDYIYLHFYIDPDSHD